MTFYKMTISVFLGYIFYFSAVFAQTSTSYADIQLLINDGKYKQALELTEQQLSQNSADTTLQAMKGFVLVQLDRDDAAEKFFIQLAKENPESFSALYNLATVYATQGKYKKAEEAVKGAFNINPIYATDATADEMLGDIYVEMAGSSLKQASELIKDNELNNISNMTDKERLSFINKSYELANLCSRYASMASRAYNQAFKLHTSNTRVKEKISFVNGLLSYADKISILSRSMPQPKRK